MLRLKIWVMKSEISCAEDFKANGFSLSSPVDFRASILYRASATIQLETGNKLKEWFTSVLILREDDLCSSTQPLGLRLSNSRQDAAKWLLKAVQISWLSVIWVYSIGRKRFARIVRGRFDYFPEFTWVIRWISKRVQKILLAFLIAAVHLFLNCLKASQWQGSHFVLVLLKRCMFI